MKRKLILLLFFGVGAALLLFTLYMHRADWSQLVQMQVAASLLVLAAVFITAVFVYTGESNWKEMEMSHKELLKDNTALTLQLADLEAAVQSNERSTALIALLQGSSSLESAATEVLKKMAKDLEICQGVFYVKEGTDDHCVFRAKGAYAYHKTVASIDAPEMGVGLVGQVAKDKKMLVLNELPAGYIEVISGLGKSQPSFVAIIPLTNKDEVVGVLELATLKTYSEQEIKYFEHVQESLGFALYLLSEKIKVNTASKLLS